MSRRPVNRSAAASWNQLELVSASPLTVVPAITNLLDVTKAGVVSIAGTPAILLDGVSSLWIRYTINAAVGDTYNIGLFGVSEDGSLMTSADITSIQISTVGTSANVNNLFYASRGAPNWNRGAAGTGTNQAGAPPWAMGIAIIGQRTAGAVANATLSSLFVELG